jgi:hypothetical protein
VDNSVTASLKDPLVATVDFSSLRKKKSEKNATITRTTLGKKKKKK